jgi:hypothetical protein
MKSVVGMAYFTFFYVVYMPSNTMPIFEPLDLGLIATSKPITTTWISWKW